MIEIRGYDKDGRFVRLEALGSPETFDVPTGTYDIHGPDGDSEGWERNGEIPDSEDITIWL